MPTPDPNPRIWRLQSGPLMHVGFLTDGRLRWQKQRIKEEGRLHSIHMHLVAAVDDGRVYASLSAETPTDLISFLTSAIGAAAALGGRPAILVTPRPLLSEHPELLDWCDQHAIEVKFATVQFKAEQKTSRHFEDYLISVLNGRHDVARITDLRELLPQLTAAWNRDEYRVSSPKSTRYSEAWKVAREHFADNPVVVEAEAFEARKVTVSRVWVHACPVTDHCYQNGYRDLFIACGFALCLRVGSADFIAPAYYRQEPFTDAYGKARFNPCDLWFPFEAIPRELATTRANLPSRLARAVSLEDLVSHANARGVAKSVTTEMIRQCILTWKHQGNRWAGEVAMCGVLPNSLREDLEAAGFCITAARWHKANKRNIWRADLAWMLTESLGVPVAEISWSTETGIILRSSVPGPYPRSGIEASLELVAGRNPLHSLFEGQLRTDSAGTVPARHGP